jgi:hypothetical protein
MKLSLPYSTKEFEQTKQMHTIQVQRLKNTSEFYHDEKKNQAAIVLELTDKLYKYINIVNYNKLSRNKCKFWNSDDAEEVCERKFNNTLSHYSANGNCCRSCSALFLNNLKNELQDQYTNS